MKKRWVWIMLAVVVNLRGVLASWVLEQQKGCIACSDLMHTPISFFFSTAYDTRKPTRCGVINGENLNLWITCAEKTDQSGANRPQISLKNGILAPRLCEPGFPSVTILFNSPLA